MVVYEKVIEKHLMAELPFMASENIMMNQVKKGGDRQELHEALLLPTQDTVLGLQVGQERGAHGLEAPFHRPVLRLLRLDHREPDEGRREGRLQDRDARRLGHVGLLVHRPSQVRRRRPRVRHL